MHMLRQHLPKVPWKCLNSYSNRLEAFLSIQEGALKALWRVLDRLGACKNNDFVWYILYKSRFQCICFDSTFRLYLGSGWSHIWLVLKRFWAALKALWSVWVAAWSSQTQWFFSITSFTNQAFNAYASTAPVEGTLEVFELVFESSWSVSKQPWSRKNIVFGV